MNVWKRKGGPQLIHGGKLPRKRVFAAILSIVIAVVGARILVPSMDAQKAEMAQVTRIANHVVKGEEITQQHLEHVEMGAYNLPKGILEEENIIGKFATVDLFPGDFVTDAKIDALQGDFFYDMKQNNRMLVTVSLNSNAAGVAAHLQRGDFVKVYTAIEDDYYTMSVTEPEALKSIQVYDIENATADSTSLYRNEEMGGTTEQIAATVTFVATQEQVKALLKAEYEGEIHLAFVERGSLK